MAKMKTMPISTRRRNDKLIRIRLIDEVVQTGRREGEQRRAHGQRRAPAKRHLVPHVGNDVLLR